MPKGKKQPENVAPDAVAEPDPNLVTEGANNGSNGQVDSLVPAPGQPAGLTTEEPPVLSTLTPSASPSYERDAKGFIKGVKYHYLPDGKIDWRKMIDPKYIVLRAELKAEIEKTYGKAYENVSTDEVDDKYLLLLLGGVKDLLKLRGFHKVSYPNRVAQPDFVSTDCEIIFIGNSETKDMPETFTDGADATPDNVEGWYAKYLTTAALNRAFVRCVRNYLGIYIVGKDEIGPASRAESSTNQTKTGVDGFGPHAMLSDLLKKHDRTFDQMKGYLVKQDFFKDNNVEEGAWKCVEDIPKELVFKITGMIKKSKA